MACAQPRRSRSRAAGKPSAESTSPKATCSISRSRTLAGGCNPGCGWCSPTTPRPHGSRSDACEPLGDGGTDRIRGGSPTIPTPAWSSSTCSPASEARERPDTATRPTTSRWSASRLSPTDTASRSLVVHHTRKAHADDFLDTVSGTQGLAGAADAVLVLTRSRGTHRRAPEGHRRDVEEAEYALDFRREPRNVADARRTRHGDYDSARPADGSSNSYATRRLTPTQIADDSTSTSTPSRATCGGWSMTTNSTRTGRVTTPRRATRNFRNRCNRQRHHPVGRRGLQVSAESTRTRAAESLDL